VEIGLNNVAHFLGRRPTRMLTPTLTDARFFRERGVAAILYGPRPYGMAQPDEHVLIEDYIRTIKVHAGIAYDYLVGNRR
jgi:acetylornithine deacetylase/succinyl-diaminopimelate desuccinylase-like protein